MSLETAGTDTPIGHLKTFAGYGEHGHDTTPEWGAIYHGADGLRWIAYQDPRYYLESSLGHAICRLEHCVLHDGVDYNRVNWNYGPHWGVCSRYIECVPRWFGNLIDLAKVLSAFPGGRTATCLMLRGVLRAAGESYYATSFDSGLGDGLDDALFEPGCEKRFEDRANLVRGFIALAKARGLKVGFTMNTAEGQVWIDGRQIRWDDQRDRDIIAGKLAYIVSLGFDAVHFDSAKHAGFWDHGHYHVWDPGNYHGVGNPIPAYALAELTWRLRQSCDRPLSFLGEYAYEDERYAKMGLTCGISYDTAMMSGEDVAALGRRQAWCNDYRVGVFVGNDNDCGARSFEERLSCIAKALFSQDYARVPVYMTAADLFPMVNTSYHDTVLNNVRWWHDGGKFHPDSWWYRHRVNEMFACAS